MPVATWMRRRAALITIGVLSSACGGRVVVETDGAGEPCSGQDGIAFEVEELASREAGRAPAAKAHKPRKTRWSLAAGPDSFWWVADDAAASASLYDRDGIKQPVDVHVPGAPAAQVYNPTTSFRLDRGDATRPARLIWSTGGGKLAAWGASSPAVPRSTTATVVADASWKGADYTGLTLGSLPCGDFIYASDHSNGTVDVYNSDFNEVSFGHEAFVDHSIPATFAPFGIRVLGGLVYVTYAPKIALPDKRGTNRGFVVAFDLDGARRFRVADGDALDSPWGLAIAPPGYGRFSGALLVGNAGDGRIHAFDLARCSGDGCYALGPLRDGSGAPIEIPGLWALDFGKGNALTGDIDSLYFTAGLPGEGGIFGLLEPKHR